LGNLVHFDEEGKRAVDYTSLLILKISQLEEEVKYLSSKIEELRKEQ
jgi:hypothetical protein